MAGPRASDRPEQGGADACPRVLEDTLGALGGAEATEKLGRPRMGVLVGGERWRVGSGEEGGAEGGAAEGPPPQLSSHCPLLHVGTARWPDCPIPSGQGPGLLPRGLSCW